MKLIKKGKPDMVFNQETKLESVERIAIQKLWGGTNMEFECSNSVGASGGLLIIWNKDFFKATNVIIQRSYILMHGVLYSEFPCTVVNVYAPNEASLRRLLWEELLVHKADSHFPVVCRGRFQ